MSKKIYFLLIVAILLFQQTPAQQIKELLNKAGNAENYPGKNELIIFDSTDVVMEESGLSHYHIHSLTKILSQKGANNNAVIKYGYDPLSAYVEYTAVVIHKKNGEIKNLDLSTCMDYAAPARAIYWGAREKMITIGRLEIGDAIEVSLYKKGYTYALLADDDEKYIPPMRGHYYDIVPFWNREPVLEKVYHLQIPKTKELKYKFYNGEVSASVDYDEDFWYYTFSKKDFSQGETESNMVAYSDVFPKLLLSTSPDWEAKSKWFFGVNEDFGSFESTLEIDQKVNEILADARNEEDSIAFLTHWVADNIRYSGISMGEGEGYTLHTGDMTFTDRCGVCKDKAGMLITMLRAAGFESYAAMTMAGSRIDRIPADQFNHSVSVVKRRNGEYQILDPTWVPFVRELWSSLEQQQNYLMGLPEGADLMITEISDPDKHYFTMKVNSELDEKGMLTGILEIEAEGQSDAGIRRMFTSSLINQWNNNLKSQILSSFPQAEIKIQKMDNPYDYLEGPIHITLEFTIKDYAIVSPEEIIVKPLVLSEIFKRNMYHLYMNTSSDQKQYAFRDRCSRKVSLSEKMQLPFIASIHYMPQTSMVSTDAASYKGMYNLEGKELSYNGSFKFYKRIYDAEEWPMYKEVTDIHKKLVKEPVILNY